MSGLSKEYSDVINDLIMKQQFICVQPRTTQALNRFDNDMDKLHSCKILEEKEQTYILSSITNRYSFEIRKEFDRNWEVIK